MKRITLTLTLMLLAAPAMAFTPERAALMVDAIRSNGCSMQGEEAEGALSPLGLTGVEVQAFVDTLYGAELVTLSDDTSVLSLVADLCAADAEASLALIVAAFADQEATLEPWRPDFAPERGAEFVAAVRGAGCTLTEEVAAQILPPLGLSPDDTRGFVTVMVDGGMASVSDAGDAITLTAEVCAADGADDAPALAAILAEWAETHPAPNVVIQRGGDE